MAEKVGLLFILIAIGFFCQRKKMLTEASNKSLADIVMYIVSPCVIINAFSANMYSREELTVVLKNIALVAGISVLAHALMIMASTLIFRMPDENRRRLMRFSAVFSNAGFIALPLPMLMVGYYLGKADLRAAFRDTSSFFCMALRLLIFPLLMLLLLWLCGVKGNVLLVSVIGASAPVGATATIFSARFSRDTDLSVRLVALSTILSLITMPVIVGLTRMIA